MMTERDRKAFDELVKMAREINPDLPEDLNGKTLTISLSIHGKTALAFCSHKKTTKRGR